MMEDNAPAALVDLDEAAEMLEMAPASARAYLDSREPPVATWRGRPFWLADTVQDAATELPA